MVSKAIEKSPTRSMKVRSGLRRSKRRTSPAAKTSSPSKLISTLNKTIHTCKRRLAKIFSKLSRVSPNLSSNSRQKGYRALKKLQERNPFECEEEAMEEVLLPTRDNCICKALFCNEKLPPLISQKKKGTVFLDLDETLVHSSPHPPPKRFDFVVRPNIEGEFMNFYVLKRPGVDEFLEALGEKFEVVVFTAGLKQYASLVLDKIDRKGVITHRFYRDSCKEVDGKFVKDLSEMGRDLKRVVIVDDNPNCYYFQPDNAVPIKPFVDDLGDEELGKLADFFDGCDRFEDMREAVKEYVSCNEWDGAMMLQGVDV